MPNLAATAAAATPKTGSAPIVIGTRAAAATPPIEPAALPISARKPIPRRSPPMHPQRASTRNVVTAAPARPLIASLPFGAFMLKTENSARAARRHRIPLRKTIIYLSFRVFCSLLSAIKNRDTKDHSLLPLLSLSFCLKAFPLRRCTMTFSPEMCPACCHMT